MDTRDEHIFGDSASFSNARNGGIDATTAIGYTRAHGRHMNTITRYAYLDRSGDVSATCCRRSYRKRRIARLFQVSSRRTHFL